jgi:hypothetical protein
MHPDSRARKLPLWGASLHRRERKRKKTLRHMDIIRSPKHAPSARKERWKQRSEGVHWGADRPVCLCAPGLFTPKDAPQSCSLASRHNSSSLCQVLQRHEEKEGRKEESMKKQKALVEHAHMSHAAPGCQGKKRLDSLELHGKKSMPSHRPTGCATSCTCRWLVPRSCLERARVQNHTVTHATSLPGETRCATRGSVAGHALTTVRRPQSWPNRTGLHREAHRPDPPGDVLWPGDAHAGEPQMRSG